jgi:sugar phosphate isomerase/epimerase
MHKPDRIGVVLEAFLDRPLEDVLTWLASAAPEVTAVEVGAGGYAPHPHLDTDELLVEASARTRWLETLHRHDVELDALNVWGNPLHPDAEIAADHDAALRRAIRLAGELGTNTVVAMAGAPAALAGDRAPVFGAGGWLPYLEGVHEQQWDDAVAPYWTELSEFAARVNPDVRLCIELHPGTAVYNVETFEKFAALGPNLYANLDPSHFFWMGMDAIKVTERIRSRIGHVHAKDTSFNTERLALNGLLDHRWPADPHEMPWNFSVPGHGHDEEYWHAFLRVLAGSPATTISIEHEDPLVPPALGVPEAAALIRRGLDAIPAETTPEPAEYSA